jgi:hypothetical protein
LVVLAQGHVLEPVMGLVVVAEQVLVEQVLVDLA